MRSEAVAAIRDKSHPTGWRGYPFGHPVRALFGKG